MPPIDVTNESSPLLGLLNKVEISQNDDPSVVTVDSGHSNTRCRRIVRATKILVAAATIYMIIAVLFQKETPAFLSPFEQQQQEEVYIAFIGNSMFYFNDFPRYFQGIASSNSKRSIYQNSVLHGGGSIPSLVGEGNAMYPQFGTDKAILTESEDGHPIYDYGACTVLQLLNGDDPTLDDPSYATPDTSGDTNKNPCKEDPVYLDFAKTYFAENSHQELWDYVLINDNTRNPARSKTRKSSLEVLNSFYVPWFQHSHATPVFLWTQAYSVESTASRNMSGLEDVGVFTSLTYAGLKEYSKLLEQALPEDQKPRIAPVGLAFLLVYEERPELWEELFHSDHVHASPSGTFLQGCIIHYTLFGEMPPKKHIITENMETLWTSARMMQHAWEPPNPIPTMEIASYLYNVAERIMVQEEKPKSFIDYQNGEAVNDIDS